LSASASEGGDDRCCTYVHVLYHDCYCRKLMRMLDDIWCDGVSWADLKV
jgi:hypothetical protein